MNKNNEKGREKYHELKKLGLCTKCRKSNDTDNVICNKCSAKDIRKKRVANGKCYKCDVPSDAYLCKPCLKKTTDSQKNRYQERLKNGFCSRCGKVKTSANSSCEQCLDKKRKEHLRKKIKVIDYYGKVCQCCSEKILAFLTIDHMNGGGNTHRREIGGHSGKKPHANSKLYGWLIRNNFPTGYQTLCFNCNTGKWMNGDTCPHQEESPVLLSDFKSEKS